MTKAYYISISNGLRGCYMPDSSHIVKIGSYREFTTLISNEIEFYDLRSTGQVRYMWELIKSGQSFNVCYATPRDNDGYGYFVSGSALVEYVTQMVSECILDDDDAIAYLADSGIIANYAGMYSIYNGESFMAFDCPIMATAYDLKLAGRI